MVETLIFLHLKWQQIIKMIQESVQCDIILGAIGLLVPQPDDTDLSLDNARMYHVQITSTPEGVDYVLGLPRITNGKN